MDGLSAAERASATLLERKQELARRITDAVYAEDPQLMERYGAVGRSKCLEDMHYNLEHLAPAVALEDPSMFTRYVLWLVELLDAYGVPALDVRRSLLSMRRVLEAELPGDESAFANAAIDAALRLDALAVA